MIEEEKNSKECGDGLNDVIDTSLFQHSHTQLHKGLSSTAKRALLATIVFGAIVWLIIDSAIAGPIHGNVFSLVAGRNIKSVVFASADAGVIRQDPQANYGRMSTLDTFISTHEVFVRFDIGHIEGKHFLGEDFRPYETANKKRREKTNISTFVCFPPQSLCLNGIASHVISSILLNSFII